MIRQVQCQDRNSTCRSGLGYGAVSAGPAPGLAELKSTACLAHLRQELGANIAAGREAEGEGSAQVGPSWLLRPLSARRALKCAS